MKHSEKIAFMLKDPLFKDISPYTSAPVLWRIFWVIGLKIKPPLFMDPLQFALVGGGIYGATLGLSLAYWGKWCFVIALVCGWGAFSFYLFNLLKKIKKNITLPRWEE